MDHITIIGKGRAGTSIAKALQISPNARLSAHIAARLKKYPAIDSEIIIIATKDDEIAAVSKKAIAAASKKASDYRSSCRFASKRDFAGTS